MTPASSRSRETLPPQAGDTLKKGERWRTPRAANAASAHCLSAGATRGLGTLGGPLWQVVALHVPSRLIIDQASHERLLVSCTLICRKRDRSECEVGRMLGWHATNRRWHVIAVNNLPRLAVYLNRPTASAFATCDAIEWLMHDT